MTIEKKSLIGSLKATKKANVVTAPDKNEGASTRKTTVERKNSRRFTKPTLGRMKA